MTPEEFRIAFDNIGWTAAGLARRLGVNEREVRRWYNGDFRVPQRVSGWVRVIAAFHAANPPPEKGA